MKRILKLGIVFALVMALVMPVSVAMASHEAGQEAETYADTILIVDKTADGAITTITFPAGLPDGTVSAPYNDVDTDAAPQVLDGAASEPVVRLKNTSGGALTVWLQITTWGNAVVVSEDYELVDEAITTVSVVDDVLSGDGNAATVDTGITMPATTYKALYLEVVLGVTAGLSGTSTLTVLGES